MGKKAFYYDQAERLYVEELHTLKQIEEKLPVSERTLRIWKEDGEWSLKKKHYFKDSRKQHEKIASIKGKILDNIDSKTERKPLVEGLREQINGDTLKPLEENPDMPWEDAVLIIQESGYDTRTFMAVHKIVMEGNYELSRWEMDYIKHLDPKKVKDYEELERAQSGLKEDVTDAIDLSKATKEELELLDEITSRLEGKKTEE